MRMRIFVSVGALLLGVSAATGQEVLSEAGRVEYLSACAGCHGQDAKGDGPMADLMKIETPDLTKLTERAGGAFPFRNTLLLIDGRNDVRAHGGEMPIWGDRYEALATSERGESEEMVVRGRILALVYYLQSIQEQ